jgi:hypothetical protein
VDYKVINTMHDYFLPLFRICYKKGSADRVGYLNLNLISQRVINLVFGKGKSKKKVQEKQKKARDIVVRYIGIAMYHWQDRDCIIAPYNFE